VLCGNVVDDVESLVVDEGAIVDVVSVDEVVVVVVVVADEGPGAMTNPQPCAGSFNIKGSETSDCVVVAEGVVVVVVDSPVDVVVVVERRVAVVVDVDGVFFVTSRPTPVNTRPSSTTRRTNRNGHRPAEGVFRDAGTLRHGNSEMS
jgi:hypothetical protein